MLNQYVKFFKKGAQQRKFYPLMFWRAFRTISRE